MVPVLASCTVGFGVDTAHGKCSYEEKAQNEHWVEIGGAIIEGGVARAAGGGGGGGQSHALVDMVLGRRGGGENDIRLEDALRVEWCKALARSRRYTEEVRLLREEMRRTIAYGAVAAADWERLAGESLAGASEELTEGRCAYAAEHALTERARADAYLAGNTDIAAVTVEVDVTDELDPEEEEARLEGDAGEDDGA
ncbi:CxC2 domain-containing protein [Mycena sanguinolenta]|uniref:CxC2 domain-containing protein n=1 Tax=Mycena sanguinolenta TaxID=230812 RepID=A0A8H6YKK9_9AGAR|nr:CxC2 domain-containing protein [Mycena sanguinolenta]